MATTTKAPIQHVFTTKKIEEIAKRNNKGYKIPFYEKYWFKNLPLVRKDGIKFNRTQEETDEYIKCKFDIHYFAEKYCRIKREDGSIGEMTLRDYQKDILDLYHNNRFSILNASRQVGKTVSAAILILHFITFNNDKNVLIVSNKLESTKEVINKIKSIYYYLPFFLKAGVSNWNQSGISFTDRNNVIKTSAATESAGIGNTIDLLYLDEFAHIPDNISENFFKSLFPTVSAIDNSKIIITSTPKGYNLFWRILNGAKKPIGDKEKNTFAWMEVYWWQVKGRYVTYLKLDSFVLQKYNITNEQIFEWVLAQGFPERKLDDKGKVIQDGAFLKFSNKSQKYEIHIPNRDENLPTPLLKIKKQRENNELDFSADDFVSDFFRKQSFEYEKVNENTGDIVEKSIKLVELSDISSWKEDAIRDIGSLESFNQEYDLQFLAGNRMIFDSQTMNKINNKKLPFSNIEIPIINDKSFINYEDLIWVKDRPDLFNLANIKNYYLCAAIDLSEGLGGDYQVINIFRIMLKEEDEFPENPKSIYDFFKLVQIGLYRNNMVSVQELGELAYILFFDVFNQDQLAVVLETNNWGGEFRKTMREMYQGRNEYGEHIFLRYKHREDAKKKNIGIKLRQNKKLYVREYQKRVKCGDINVHEEDTIHEMTTFIKKKSKSGNSYSFEADSGNNDDITMTIVELSTVFDNYLYQDLVNRLFDELDTQTKNKIEALLGESDYTESIDYSILKKANNNFQRTMNNKSLGTGNYNSQSNNNGFNSFGI